MGLRSDHACGRPYGRCGETPVIPGTGKRFGCNMVSAITNRGRLYFMIFKQRFQSDVFTDFLRRLVRQVPRYIFLIIDPHPVHIAAKVKMFRYDSQLFNWSSRFLPVIVESQNRSRARFVKSRIAP